MSSDKGDLLSDSVRVRMGTAVFIRLNTSYALKSHSDNRQVFILILQNGIIDDKYGRYIIAEIKNMLSMHLSYNVR